MALDPMEVSCGLLAMFLHLHVVLVALSAAEATKLCKLVHHEVTLHVGTLK